MALLDLVLGWTCSVLTICVASWGLCTCENGGVYIDLRLWLCILSSTLLVTLCGVLGHKTHLVAMLLLLCRGACHLGPSSGCYGSLDVILTSYPCDLVICWWHHGLVYIMCRWCHSHVMSHVPMMSSIGAIVWSHDPVMWPVMWSRLCNLDVEIQGKYGRLGWFHHTRQSLIHRKSDLNMSQRMRVLKI